MPDDPDRARGGRPHLIEISLRDFGQLFNTMDPSPFHEKDLDEDAEEFIVSWAREYPYHEPLTLVVHLRQFPPAGNPEATIAQGIHHYFEYRARLNRMEFRYLLKEGRQSLAIGVVFLAVCLIAGEALSAPNGGASLSVLRESLTIGGWVAMWRPMEIYLYQWWPLRSRGKLFDKLSRIPVEVRRMAGPAPTAPPENPIA